MSTDKRKQQLLKKKLKHILFISDNFPPEVNAPATRTFEHCREWVKAGVKVTVITCVPNYPKGIVFEGYKNKLKQVEYIEGIKVVRVWSYIAPNRGTVKRILDYISFAFSAFWAGLFEKADVIVATSPQFFTTITGYLLSVFKRKPWVFELRDLWPDTIVDVNAIRNKYIIGFLERLELFLYKKADLIIPVTDAFKENLVRRGIDASKIKVVTNGANLELFKPREKDLELLKKLGIGKDKFLIGYIGTHGMAHGLDFILRSIAKLDNDSLHFLFVGEGSEKEKLLELASKLNLKNVTFHPGVTKKEVPRFISILDAALVPLKKTKTFLTVIPSKIFELCSMRKPILLGVDGQARKVVEEYNAGIAFTPEDEEDFLKKLKILTGNKEAYERYKKGCEKLAVEYDRKRKAEYMLELLRQLK